MQRFYNRPSRANAKFSRMAFRIHPLNLNYGNMRGGMRLG